MIFNNRWLPISSAIRNQDNGFSSIFDLQRRFDSLLDEVFGYSPEDGQENQSKNSMLAKYDVNETDQHYLLSFDLPGVPKDINRSNT